MGVASECICLFFSGTCISQGPWRENKERAWGGGGDSPPKPSIFKSENVVPSTVKTEDDGHEES